jgi:hypothetical protein
MNYENLSDLYSSSLDYSTTNPYNTMFKTQFQPQFQPQFQSIPSQNIPQQFPPQNIPQQFPPQNNIPQQFPTQNAIQVPIPVVNEPPPCQACSISTNNRQPIVMNGTNPIRNGMITASYPTACSQYGSSNINLGPGEFYTGTPWCQVGIAMSYHTMHFNNIYILEAQYIGNSWSFRVKDPMTSIFIYLDTIGKGQNGAYRTDDVITIPGKEGLWKVQIQVQKQPYLLYVP